MLIKVLVCRVGQDPVVEQIENTLKPMQEVVDGHIEVVALSRNPSIDLVCDEEFLYKNKPINRVLWQDGWREPMVIAGDFLICGADEATGEFVSLTDEQIEKWRSWVATSMNAQQMVEKVLAVKFSSAKGAALGTCTMCGSTKVADADYRDEISRRESKITGTCQNCQDQLFREPHDG